MAHFGAGGEVGGFEGVFEEELQAAEEDWPGDEENELGLRQRGDGREKLSGDELEGAASVNALLVCTCCGSLKVRKRSAAVLLERSVCRVRP